jgi:hypothetical protein
MQHSEIAGFRVERKTGLGLSNSPEFAGPIWVATEQE